MKMEQLGVKVPPEVKQKLTEQAAAAGMEFSDYVRVVLSSVAADGTHPVVRGVRHELAQALVLVRTAGGRQTPTERAVEIVKDYFLAGEFAEAVRS